MKRIKAYYIMMLCVLAFSIGAYAIDLPVRTIGNTEFYCYKVKAKETIYGISKKLNISQEDLKKYNPSIRNGLKKDFVLLIPTHLIDDKEQRELVFNTDTISTTVFHTIVKGETLYSLSKRYNTTIEGILSLNPGISPSNFKIDDEIKIVPNTIKPELIATVVTEMESYVAEKGDNYKKISKRTGVDIDELKSANPNVSKVKEGVTIQIPVQKEDSVMKIASEGSVEELIDNKSHRIKEIYDSVHSKINSEDVNIAFLLPYMLNDTLPAKQALLYTEFYKGFLLAIKNAGGSCEHNINIFAYDTQNNVNTLDSILSLPEMKQMDIIFGDDGGKYLDKTADFCQENKAYLVNMFSVKAEKYNDNPFLLQVNIPQSLMQNAVGEWIETEFQGYEVVFVHKQGSTKKDMADYLKAYLSEKGIPVHDVEYKTSFTYDLLGEKLEPTKKYLFIPTSGTKSTMSKLLSVVKRLRAERVDLETAVCGYPEWVTYIDDWSDEFHETNTYFYSRFFVNPLNTDVEKMERNFNRWYGCDMIDAAPRFGILGYDMATYLLTSICENENNQYNLSREFEGLQSAFKFERNNNWSGYVNKAIFFIHFTPDYKIESVVK